jgi:2-keto-3-deoxy-L-rhamnonate aldolase RhmA
MLRLILITNIPEIAVYAESVGVERIMVDLEVLGKQARQGQFDTVMNQHTFEDVAQVRKVLSQSELLVRLNSLYDGTAAEVEKAISLGADSIMLPLFYSAEEAERFCKLVDGRCRVVLLVETPAAMVRLHHIVQVPGVSEIYIGLNDLRIGMGLDFLFESVGGGLIEYMSKIIKEAGLPFGFGGIARIGEGELSARLVLSEHVRVGSASVILGRVFHRNSRTLEEFQANINLSEEVGKLWEAERRLRTASPEDLMANHRQLREIVSNIARRIRQAQKDKV